VKRSQKNLDIIPFHRASRTYEFLHSLYAVYRIDVQLTKVYSCREGNMNIYRRDFVIGTGAAMSAAVFTQACGRAKPGPRSVHAGEAVDPPIIDALRYGITAPSAHNTQPWRIELISDTEARLFMDRERLLPATDPPGRQVHISHGTLPKNSG
jgi:hypothetical protein